MSKKSYGKYLGIFSAVNLILSFLLFITTQTPGPQHMLPFVLWVLIISFLGAKWVIDLFPSLALRRGILIFGSIVSILICAGTFHKFNGLPSFFNNIIFPKKAYPLQVDNFDNYEKLAIQIEQWGAAGKTTSIIASGHLFNDDMIKTVAGERINRYLLPQSNVDLTNLLNINAFLSDYTIITDPAQTHLPKGQNVITIPVQVLLSGENIGAAYKRLPMEYELASGVKALVFEKTRPFTDQESKEFLLKFITIYPDWEELYLTPQVLEVMQSDNLKPAN